MQRYYVIPSDFRLALDPATIVHGDALLGGTPFRLVRLSGAHRRAVERWQRGEAVGDDGALARALVHANLAQPLPPAGNALSAADVTVVVPTRDRDVSHLRDAIVVDDGSRVPVAGAAVRHAAPRGAAAARNAGAKLVETPLVAFLDSDTRPREGWLDAILPHFRDARVALVAPRIVAARTGGRLGRYEAAHSPLDRGPLPARVVAKGRVPFVPGAALVMRTALARFDETLNGGEDVDLVWRLNADGHHVRYEPSAEVEHAHRTDARAWLARRAYYGRTAAPLAQRHPNHARPLHMSPWTAAAYVALAAKRPGTAAAITALATALLARQLRDARLAARLVAGGTFGARHLVADAIVRQYWPLALARPRALALAAATKSPLATLDALAYGTGVWHGCIAHRTLDPLTPDLTWRMVECDAGTLIKLAG